MLGVGFLGTSSKRPKTSSVTLLMWCVASHPVPPGDKGKLGKL